MKFSLKEDIISISEFKANFKKIQRRVKNTNRPIAITQNGKTTGVFMNIELWEKFLRKLSLYRCISEGELSLNKNIPFNIEEVDEYIKKKYS